MKNEIKTFEKTLIKLGFTLTWFEQNYRYENNIKKVIDDYKIHFSKNYFYELIKSAKFQNYVLKKNDSVIYETSDYKDMINFLTKIYEEV